MFQNRQRFPQTKCLVWAVLPWCDIYLLRDRDRMSYFVSGYITMASTYADTTSVRMLKMLRTLKLQIDHRAKSCHQTWMFWSCDFVFAARTQRFEQFISSTCSPGEDPVVLLYSGIYKSPLDPLWPGRASLTLWQYLAWISSPMAQWSSRMSLFSFPLFVVLWVSTFSWAE